MPPPVFEPRFLLAVALLAGFFAVRSWTDLRKNGARAYAWREYTALFACGLAGAAFAAALDSATARVSPEYFSLGKGVPRDGAFAMRVICRGLQSGFAAGMVLGATLLFVAGKNAPAGARRSR